MQVLPARDFQIITDYFSDLYKLVLAEVKVFRWDTVREGTH